MSTDPDQTADARADEATEQPSDGGISGGGPMGTTSASQREIAEENRGAEPDDAD